MLRRAFALRNIIILISARILYAAVKKGALSALRYLLLENKSENFIHIFFADLNKDAAVVEAPGIFLSSHNLDDEVYRPRSLLKDQREPETDLQPLITVEIDALRADIEHRYVDRFVKLAFVDALIKAGKLIFQLLVDAGIIAFLHRRDEAHIIYLDIVEACFFDDAEIFAFALDAVIDIDKYLHKRFYGVAAFTLSVYFHCAGFVLMDKAFGKLDAIF
jgi:hypothetical protein